MCMNLMCWENQLVTVVLLINSFYDKIWIYPILIIICLIEAVEKNIVYIDQALLKVVDFIIEFRKISLYYFKEYSSVLWNWKIFKCWITSEFFRNSSFHIVSVNCTFHCVRCHLFWGMVNLNLHCKYMNFFLKVHYIASKLAIEYLRKNQHSRTACTYK